jgi:hypothetical protein
MMNKRLAILFLATILFLSATPAFAVTQRDLVNTQTAQGEAHRAVFQETPLLEPVGGWPYGSAEAIAVDVTRSFVFLGSGGAVLVLDVSNPGTPILVSDQIKTQGFVEDLFYDPATQRLYVAAGQGGMEIWDMQIATAPQRLSATEILYFDVDIPVEGITVVGDMAYVAGDWGFLHWIDVSNPVAPVQVGFDGQAVRPTDVVATSDHVYAVGNDTGAFFLGDFATYAIQPNGSLDYGGGRDFGICVSAAIGGDYAYVGCGSWYILDLTDPSLSTVGTLPIDAGGTVISDTVAFVASGSSGLHAVNIANPSAPQEMSVYDTPGSANDLARIGDVIYLADGASGLRVVDVSNPAAIVEVGFYDTPGWTQNAAIEGDTAYLANGVDGMLIVDLSEPTTAMLTGRYDTVNAVYDVAVQGSYAYVADLAAGLRIVDVSNSSHPVEIGFYDGVNAFRVAVEGDYAYVIDSVVNQPYWLRVIDVSNPDAPAEVGALQVGTLAWRVVVRGDFVYVANNDSGLRIIDVSDPTQPVQVGVYPAANVWDVALQGDYAYVASADWNGGFLVLDVSDPTNPTLAARYNPSGWFHPYHVAVDGQFAYVTRQDELHLFDIANPTSPQFLEQIDLPLNAGGLTAVGPTVYVAAANAGLPIFNNLGVIESMDHVGDLDALSRLAGAGRWQTRVIVKVEDSVENPVVDATVHFSLTTDTGAGPFLRSCTTSSNGTCAVRTTKLPTTIGSVTFKVDNVTHAEYAYAAAANHDPDGDSNGTEITVLQP